jgi:hypothetical protein
MLPARRDWRAGFRSAAAFFDAWAAGISRGPHRPASARLTTTGTPRHQRHQRQERRQRPAGTCRQGRAGHVQDGQTEEEDQAGVYDEACERPSQIHERGGGRARFTVTRWRDRRHRLRPPHAYRRAGPADRGAAARSRALHADSHPPAWTSSEHYPQQGHDRVGADAAAGATRPPSAHWRGDAGSASGGSTASFDLTVTNGVGCNVRAVSLPASAGS